MKLSSKQSALVKSYWHAFIAVEVAFVVEYAKNYIATPHAKFNFVSFAYAAIGAVAAPLTRALVAKYPWLSPLALRVTTKIAQEAAVNSNSSADVTIIKTAPAATTSASGATN
jgi:hypothetical protein